MALLEGRSPEYPVCGASAILLDPTQQHMLAVTRRATRNEKRHLDTVSTITRRIPRILFNMLAGGDPATWKEGMHPLAPPAGRLPRVGNDEHGLDPNVFAVESVLGKAGLTGALAEGAITATIAPRARSLTHVADKDTAEAQWTAMLHYTVVLDAESDLTAIPHSSEAYDPMAWVDANKVSRAYAKGDASLLGNAVLDRQFLCLTGACMSGAAYILGQT